MNKRASRGANGNQGSKWIPKAKRQAIYERDSHRCLWCGEHKSDLTLDHFVPRWQGGSNLSNNVFTACLRCNSRRKGMSVLDFAHKMSFDRPGPWRDYFNRIVTRVLEAIGNPIERRLQR